MDSILTKTDYELLAALRKCLRESLRVSEEGARSAGLTPQQHHVLIIIMGQPGRDWASIAEIASSLHLRHHTVVGLIDRSVNAGLVARQPDPDDRRQVRVVLTQKGQDLLGKLSPQSAKELRTLREMIKIEQVSDFIKPR